MLGNCEVGRLSIATTPTMTMMIDITMATMGRLIKNFDMVYLPSLPAYGFSAAFRCVARCGARAARLVTVRLLRRVGMRMDGNAVHQLAVAFDHHLVARLESAGDHPVRADLRSYLHRLDMHLVVAVDDGHLIGALQLRDCALRHEKSVMLDLGLRAYLAVLARTQQVLRVGKGCRHPDGAGRRGSLRDRRRRCSPCSG